MTLRRVALVTLAVSVALAIPATAGFSSTSVDRSVQVSIVPDDSAFLSFEQDLSNTNMTTGTTDLDVTITNQFGLDTTLDAVEVTVDGRTESVGPLGPGDAGTADFSDVDCDSTADVVASGSDVSVELDREVGC
jgi:Protein of unknown function (DUF1102).